MTNFLVLVGTLAWITLDLTSEQCLEDNRAWELVNVPKNVSIEWCEWVYEKNMK